MDSARAAVDLVPEANVTVVDTKTLSGASGWQVAAAFNAIKMGWSKEKILEKLKEISESAHSFYTLKELKYLIHGGPHQPYQRSCGFSAADQTHDRCG